MTMTTMETTTTTPAEEARVGSPAVAHALGVPSGGPPAPAPVSPP